MGINDTTTLSHHPYILCHFAMLSVCCVQRRVVEGSGIGSGGCVVHFDVNYVVGCCIVVAILSMAEMVCLDCMQKLCSA